MKKNLFLVAALFAGTVAFAQTTEVKDADGMVVTPQAGDWGLGFNASPMINYVGNMFNGNTNNTLNAGYVAPNQAIYGKYFKDENTAYRASVRLMTGSGTQIVQTDTSSISGVPAYVEDKIKQSGAGVVLSVGLEKRRGHNRLQGYYGAEAAITFGGVNPKMKYTYGAELNSVNIANGGAVNGRTLSSKGGATFGFGVRGFIGAEYFFAPKISIAAEYGWGVSLAKTAGTEVVKEYFDANGTDASITTNALYQQTTTTGKSSSFNIDTDNLGGAIRLMFHF